MAQPMIGFRVSKQWYKDFADYMTAQGVEKRDMFEVLMDILFVRMTDEALRDLSVKEKFEKAITNLKKI